MNDGENMLGEFNDKENGFPKVDGNSALEKFGGNKGFPLISEINSWFMSALLAALGSTECSRICC